MHGTLRTAILPVAGRGTRMLPATRAVPKELLPVLDRPLIDFAIDEALAAGVERIVFVTAAGKAAIRRHVLAAPPAGVDCVFVLQTAPLGLGHAVLCAAPHVLPGPVAVILPDDHIAAPPFCLAEMAAAYPAAAAGHLVAAMRVPETQVARYGIFDPTGEDGRLLRARGIVEKPDPLAAPSCDAAVGRYVLAPSIFPALARLAPGAGGEYQLTDALAADAATAGLAGYRFTGRRYDCGSREGLFAASLARAATLPEFCALVAPPRETPLASAA